jgi:hypothetical protein
MQEVPFEAREGWTYELKDQEANPQWVYAQEYGNPLKPLCPGELVIIGLQLEDRPRLERKVKRDLSEHGLKLMMWQELGYPRGPLHLHIKNECDDMEFAFKISPHWTYVLRRRPRDTLRNKQERRSVNNEEGDMQGATRKIREAKTIEKSGTAGAGNKDSAGTRQKQGMTGGITFSRDGEQVQTVRVAADTKAQDLTRLLMERIRMTGMGYLAVRWNGKPGSYAISADAVYEISARQSQAINK